MDYQQRNTNTGTYIQRNTEMGVLRVPDIRSANDRRTSYTSRSGNEKRVSNVKRIANEKRASNMNRRVNADKSVKRNPNMNRGTDSGRKANVDRNRQDNRYGGAGRHTEQDRVGRPEVSGRAAYYMRRLGINSGVIIAIVVLTCIIIGCSIGIFYKNKDNAAGTDGTYGTFAGTPAGAEATNVPTEADYEAVDETVYETLEDYDLWKNYTAEDKEKVRYVLLNKSKYNDDLIEKIKTNEELVDYVYNYPEEYGKTHAIDVSGEVKEGQVPLFLQWDKRWGYIPYGSGLIGYTACGPTCISMVSVYYTGNIENTPDVVAAYAENSGYYVDGKGTAWSFMTQGCENFGIKGREISLNEDVMKSELEQGRPIICIMDKGIFTTSGHFIVLTGYKDGGFVVNDPNSPEKSARTWTYDEIHDQISNLWSYEKLD